MSHTPEPWTIETSLHGLLGVYGNGESKAVCGTIRKEVRDKTNLARIVAAVNGCAGLNPAAYRECVEALKEALARLEQHEHPDTTRLIRIKRALAHAQEVA